MDHADGLNPEQAEAVLLDPDEAPALILAGAGSGKTTVLARRIAWLMSRRGGGILALTFTAAAAREMEARVEALAGPPGSPARISRSGRAVFGTFHAFAFRLIRADREGTPNWRLLGFRSCPRLLEPEARRAWLARQPEAGAGGEPLDVLERVAERPFTAEGPEGAAGPAAALRARFRDHLLAEGAVAFDDMVTLAIRLLSGHPAVAAAAREEISHVLVDEFQDTSPDQLELVRLIVGGRRSLFLVGDDDQSIYGFRGADPRNIPRALEAFPGMRILKLETNYRSSAPIVAYANAIFADKPEPLRKTLRAGREGAGEAPVRVLLHADGMEQARWMAGEILRLRAAGLPWNGIAILYRLNSLEPYYRSLLSRLVGAEAAEQVRLRTVHASKGLQYPAVFLVGLEDGILPYRRGGAATPAGDALAEERRIFYVGVTRAERHLYLCSCRRRVMRGKARELRPSPFLAARRGGWLKALAGRWGAHGGTGKT